MIFSSSKLRILFFLVLIRLRKELSDFDWVLEIVDKQVLGDDCYEGGLVVGPRSRRNRYSKLKLFHVLRVLMIHDYALSDTDVSKVNFLAFTESFDSDFHSRLV